MTLLQWSVCHMLFTYLTFYLFAFTFNFLFSYIPLYPVYWYPSFIIRYTTNPISRLLSIVDAVCSLCYFNLLYKDYVLLHTLTKIFNWDRIMAAVAFPVLSTKVLIKLLRFMFQYARNVTCFMKETVHNTPTSNFVLTQLHQPIQTKHLTPYQMEWKWEKVISSMLVLVCLQLVTFLLVRLLVLTKVTRSKGMFPRVG